MNEVVLVLQYPCRAFLLLLFSAPSLLTAAAVSFLARARERAAARVVSSRRYWRSWRRHPRLVKRLAPPFFPSSSPLCCRRASLFRRPSSSSPPHHSSLARTVSITISWRISWAPVQHPFWPESSSPPFSAASACSAAIDAAVVEFTPVTLHFNQQPPVVRGELLFTPVLLV